MLKFIKGHMSSITDISIYPVMAFVLFFLMFIAATWFIMTTSRVKIQHLKDLPFNDQDKSGTVPQSTARQ